VVVFLFPLFQTQNKIAKKKEVYDINRNSVTENVVKKQKEEEQKYIWTRSEIKLQQVFDKAVFDVKQIGRFFFTLGKGTTKF
jgi:hypothetical protein